MSDLRIIVTGGRKRCGDQDCRTLAEAIFTRLPAVPVPLVGDRRVVIIQGGCPDGVDAMARNLALSAAMGVETYPADFDRHPDDAVELSNQAMVDRGADLCIAMPNAPADGPSLGTWDMIRRAVAAGIETRIYPEAAS
ncbi:hypothetical protein BIBE0010001c01_00014 [Bifidobacterium phage BigBern1]|nr:hypothetical protein BIBE0010001c01_00014 [Bifidobacterium phage BigBern1]